MSDAVRYAIVCALGGAALAWHLLIFRCASRLRLVKPNYNKRPIMASYGIVAFPYAAVAVVAAVLFGLADAPTARLYLWVMGAMWLLGAADDIFGSREVGGFKGHFRKLLCERRLTTGAAKAIGGGCVGLAAGWVIYGPGGVPWFVAGAVIALCANLLNLVDLRPGRAVAVFLAGIVVSWLLVSASLQAPWVVGSIAVVALAFGFADSRARAMMGDSGSNSLGAALGLTIVLNSGLAVQLLAATAILAIHMYSEKHSISELIERNPILRSIDRRLGVR